MSIKKNYGRYMTVIGPVGNFMFYFQFYEIMKQKDAGSVSLMGFAISVVALSSWLVYGFILKDKPLIIANCVGAVGAILVTAGILVYS